MHPFHIALPAYDLSKSREFYGKVLGLKERRSAPNWADFDFFGHQLSLHLIRGKNEKPEAHLIDGDQVPTRHFGIIQTKEDWEALRDRLKEWKQPFVIGPRLRFEGAEGEQWTMFTTDPANNYLEFKYFTDRSRGAWY
jgi:uncharacterized protein